MLPLPMDVTAKDTRGRARIETLAITVLAALALLGCSKPPATPPESHRLPPVVSSASHTIEVSREYFRDPSSITYAIRLPASAPVPPDVECEWFSGDDSQADDPLFLMHSRTEDGMRVFASSPWLFLSRATNQTFVVSAPGRPAEVFGFSAPPTPHTGQWSAWLKPTYTEANHPSHLDPAMATARPPLRHTNDPAALFEFRFKFTDGRSNEVDAASEFETPEETP
jgi:hypothetical protein